MGRLVVILAGLTLVGCGVSETKRVDVLELSAPQHYKKGEGLDALIDKARNWDRKYIDGVWCQPASGRHPIEPTFSQVEAACLKYLGQPDERDQWKLVNYVTHARLWALTFHLESKDPKIIVEDGGATVWCDALEKRVVAETGE